jgi:hypothetical protein
MATNQAVNARRFIRFRAAAGTIAQVEIKLSEDLRTFQPNHIMIVHEESQKGFGAISLSHRLLKPGTKCRVKVGRLSPRFAEVRWRKDPDKDIMRLGFQYLD